MRISYCNIQGRILDRPHSKCEIIVVIPCYAENEILHCLSSLNTCPVDDFLVEVILLINESIDVSLAHQAINELSYQEVLNFIHGNSNESIHFNVVYVSDIPTKIAGVGLARRLAMDVAVYMTGAQSIICNLDADCVVRSDYFQEIYRFFQQNKKIECGSIYFEHPTQSASKLNDQAIIQYELHLRYFIAMQRKINLPFAFQTIGSSFAIRANSYNSVGGMNLRKAGEDFYFIHKYAKKGTLGDIRTTVVYPSSRSSFRVPFGTGRAVGIMIDEDQSKYMTYDPRHFENLKDFAEAVSQFYHQDDISAIVSKFNKTLQDFLIEIGFSEKLTKIKENVNSETSFVKAFFQWFDAFKLMKYLHYCRDHSFPNLSVMEAIANAKEMLNIQANSLSSRETLMLLRKKALEEDYGGLSEVQTLSPNCQ